MAFVVVDVVLFAAVVVVVVVVVVDCCGCLLLASTDGRPADGFDLPFIDVGFLSEPASVLEGPPLVAAAGDDVKSGLASISTFFKYIYI